MTRLHQLVPIPACLFFGAAMLVLGCDESLDPFENERGDRFAVHGYLDTSVDTQIVRVEAFRPAILSPEPDLSDLIVTTQVEPQGEVVQWTPDSVELLNGSEVTVFTASFRPIPGATYHLNVHRPGREGTRAVTHVPTQPGFVVADPVNLIQTVFLSDLPRTPDLLAVKYDVIVPEDNEKQSVQVVYQDDSSQSNLSGRVDVRLQIDQAIVEGRLFRSDTDDPLTLERIGLVVRLPSKEFERGGSDNVTAGEGFFGSVAEFDLAWVLETNVVLEMGFEDGQQTGK